MVTSQKPAEAPSTEQILDSLPQAVLMARSDRSICYANASAESVFKASASFLRKHSLDDFVPVNSPVLGLVERALNKVGPVNEYQIDISSPRTGVGKVFDVHATVIDGFPGQVLLVLRERGMADRIDRQLSHRGAARSVTGLASMLAHEIKNPLSGIRGAAQLLGSVVDESDQPLSELITSETDRIVKILDRMEVFSDESPIRPEPVNMHSVLGRVRAIAKSGFGSEVEFREAFDPSLPPVSGSHDQLIQVFLNLVKNAVEAMKGRKKPRITLGSAYRSGVHLSTSGGRKKAALPLEFSVTDTGPGIPEELRAYIFDPFVTSRINGSGLGLALVAKIIERHGGIVECDNHRNGAIFRVLLPAWDEKSSAPNRNNPKARIEKSDLIEKSNG